MDVAAVYLELYGRIPPLVREAVDGLTPEQLRWVPATGHNPIGWLGWHIGRVQDLHVAELLDADQLWAAGAWAASFGLTPEPANVGYGHTPEEVRAVRPSGPEAVVAYLEAVDARTRDFLRRVTPGDLDRIVDRRWEPPVTMGVRLVSIADDGLQHAGQAAYVRGLLARTA